MICTLCAPATNVENTARDQEEFSPSPSPSSPSSPFLLFRTFFECSKTQQLCTSYVSWLEERFSSDFSSRNQVRNPKLMFTFCYCREKRCKSCASISSCLGGNLKVHYSAEENCNKNFALMMMMKFLGDLLQLCKM